MTTLQPARRAGMAATAVLLAACASGVQSPPAESLTSSRTPGRFIWHDLVTGDLAAAKRFYGGMLGWTFQPVEGTKGKYVFIRNGDRVIGGMAEVKDRINVSQWISHVSVEDVDRVVRAAEAAGGGVAVKPFAAGKRARVAVLKDPSGAPFGIARLEPGDPAVRTAGMSDWLWHELWTGDKAGASAFYTGLFGYRADRIALGSRDYELFRSGDDPRAGLQQLPNPKIGPNWLPYVRVADVRSLAARAAELGGEVLVAPSPELRNGTVILVKDPTGAALALQEWDGKGGS